jgi:DNA-binding transcriptional LysR family regulator
MAKKAKRANITKRARKKGSSASVIKDIQSLDDLKVLRAFLCAARPEVKSFRQAARELKIPQALVLQRITQLERYMNVSLFQRDYHDHRLTALSPEGQEFRNAAEDLIRQRDRMVGLYRDPSTVRGIVRLGVSESIVHTWLPVLLKQVHDAYPNLEFQIEVDISPRLQDLLIAGELNLAFMLGPIDVPELRSRPLCQLPVGFVANKDIGLPPSTTLKEIVEGKHRLITFARNTQPLRVLRDVLYDRRLHATIWASASLEAVVRLAVDGLGIAVIPPDILKNRPGAGAKDRLFPLNTDIQLPPLNYVVSWPTASPKGADATAVEKVIDIALKVAQGGRREEV